MLNKILSIFIILFFLAGCALKPHINFSAPYRIIIKTKNIAIADSGFLQKAKGYKSIEIFSVGKLILHVELNEDACINGTCTDRIDFNERFFGYKHYADILDDILDKKEIYGGINKIKIKNGFEQNIITKNYDIIYKITDKSIYFKDRVNHILVKLRRL